MCKWEGIASTMAMSNHEMSQEEGRKPPSCSFEILC